MKKLTTILIGIAIFLALATVIAYLLPRKIRVERSMVMNAPIEVVFNEVNTLKQWEKWTVWDRIDSAMAKKYEGPEMGANAKFSWESNNHKVGKGAMTIKHGVPNDSISVELAFGEMTPSMAYFKFSKEEKGTKVSWAMEMDMGMNPIARYFGLFMDKMLGPDFEGGLANMKEIVEKMPPPAKLPEDYLKIVETTVQQQNILMVHVKCHEKEIAQNLGMSYQKIGQLAKKNKANMTGAPIAIYQQWENDNFEFDAAVPFDKKMAGAGDVKAGEIKTGKVVMTNFYGPYDQVHKGHEVIKEWIKANDKKKRGDAWEVYASDPGAEKDSSKWLTQIYYPID